MAWAELPARRRRFSRIWGDGERRRLIHMGAPLTYEVGDGTLAPVDLTPQRVQTAALDGWRIANNGWHYALGIPGSGVGAGQDGWVGFGGRRGQHWFRSRLTRLGYLHWPTRAWQDVGGAPTYSRANLTSTAKSVDLGPETQVVESVAEWRRLWSTPQAGECFVRWQLDGARLKEDVVINAAGRNWIRNNRPPQTPAAETWFGFVFEVDWSDIPRAVIAGVLQDQQADFTDGAGGVELRGAADELLAFLPVDELVVGTGRITTRVALQKRFWRDTDTGRTYLLVGLRTDILAGLPPGDLVFDPTIQEQITATADDGYSESPTSWFNNMIYVGSGNAGQGGHRYQTVGIPQSAPISSAVLRPVAGADNDGPTSVAMVLAADDVDDAPAFANGSAPHGIVGTTATASWTPAAWVNGTRYTSPSLVAPLQEVVDRPGFTDLSDIRWVWRAPTGGAWAAYLQIQDYASGAANATIFDAEWTEGGGAPVELGVPFSGAAGADYAPAVDEGVSITPLVVPFSTPAGADHTPGVAAGVAIAASFAGTAGADHAPGVVLGVPADTIAVPFAASAGAAHTPGVAVTSQAMGVPTAAADGLDLAPGIQEGVPAAALAIPFDAAAAAEYPPAIAVSAQDLSVPLASAAGQDFAPSIEEGVPAGVVAVPFAPELGNEYAPGIIEAAAIAVPFSGAAGEQYAPAVTASVVALEVPFAIHVGSEHAPGISTGPITLFIPFSPAAGAAFAPLIGSKVAILPEHYFIFEGVPDRGFTFAGAPTRSFAFRRM